MFFFFRKVDFFRKISIQSTFVFIFFRERFMGNPCAKFQGRFVTSNRQEYTLNVPKVGFPSEKKIFFKLVFRIAKIFGSVRNIIGQCLVTFLDRERSKNWIFENTKISEKLRFFRFNSSNKTWDPFVRYVSTGGPL
jgi:hypothetical protein